jgi:hypothetical protein
LVYFLFNKIIYFYILTNDPPCWQPWSARTYNRVQPGLVEAFVPHP